MIVNAFLLIGLNLSTRDALHEAWHGRGLIWKMGVLIVCGGAITWMLNHDAGRIAIASTVAFAAATATDALIYSVLFEHGRLVKMNGSNVVSAAVDSLVFPTVAFGVLMPWIVLGQFVAKVGGGFLWSLVLTHRARSA